MRSPCLLMYDPSAENAASSATTRSLPGVNGDFATCRKAHNDRAASLRPWVLRIVQDQSSSTRINQNNAAIHNVAMPRSRKAPRTRRSRSISPNLIATIPSGSAIHFGQTRFPAPMLVWVAVSLRNEAIGVIEDGRGVVIQISVNDPLQDPPALRLSRPTFGTCWHEAGRCRQTASAFSRF